MCRGWPKSKDGYDRHNRIRFGYKRTMIFGDGAQEFGPNNPFPMSASPISVFAIQNFLFHLLVLPLGCFFERNLCETKANPLLRFE